MNLSSDFLPERQNARHRRILVFAAIEMLANQLAQPLWAIEVGEPLREVDSAVLGGHFGHYREDSCADLREL